MMILNQNSRPVVVYVLWILTGFLSLSGLAGGLAMVADPTGKTMRLPAIFLMGTPFNDYLVPGLVLLLFLGLIPALGFIGLLGIGWRWPERLNLYKQYHWGWTYSLYVAVILILWSDFQVYLIGYWHPFQTFYALLGVIILILTLLPPVVKYFRVDRTG